MTTKWLLCTIIAVLVVSLAITPTTTYSSGSSLDDYSFEIIWSKALEGIISSNAPVDFNGDGVYDIVSIGRHRLVIIDPVSNTTLYDYVLSGSRSIVVVKIIDDINGDGYVELAIIYIDRDENTISMDLVEPAINETLVSQSYQLGVSVENTVYGVLNGLIDYDNGLLEVAIGYYVLQGFSIEQGTYIYRFDLYNGEDQPVDEISGKIYIIWTNEVPADLDGDGFVEVSHDTVKAYLTISMQVYPPSIEIDSSMEVKPEGSPWSWSKSFENAVAVLVFRPYTTPTSVLDVLVVTLSVSGGSVEPDTLDIIGYRLADGYKKYTCSIDLSSYSVSGLSILGGQFSISLARVSDREGFIYVYDGYTGDLYASIDIGYVEEGYNITTSSIGDLDSDGDRDLLVGKACELYLVDTSGSIDLSLIHI